MRLASLRTQMPDSASAPETNDRMHPGTGAQELPATSGRKSRFRLRAFALLTEVHFSAVSVPQWLCTL